MYFVLLHCIVSVSLIFNDTRYTSALILYLLQAGLSMEGVGGVTIQAIGLEMDVGEEGQVLSLVQIDDNMTQLWGL